MVFGRRSTEEGSRNSNPSIHLRSPRSKIRKDEQLVLRQTGLPLCKKEFEALVRKVVLSTSTIQFSRSKSPKTNLSGLMDSLCSWKITILGVKSFNSINVRGAFGCKWVREEVNQALRLHTLQRSLFYEAEPSVERSFLLCFDCRFPNRVFTGNKIEAEGPGPLKVILQDANTGAVVSDAPFSSMRIECVVLHGDFKAEEQTNWTEKEFNDNILREREGRRPLLIGERSITLNNGVGHIKDLSFTDNSSWVRSKRFRLGVKVTQGSCPDVGVQEAVSGAFEVRDRRGEPYQKHGTPSLEDEVWRLYKIAKDGPHSKRLAANGICTVRDFLQRYYIDESSLRNILGVSNKVWEAIVEHAKSCSLNNDHYSYFSAEDGVGLLFNCVLNIIGVTYDGQNYQPLETLSKAQKFQVDKLRRYAYQNQNQLIPTDVPAMASNTSSPCGPRILSASSSLTDLHLLEDQSHKDMDCFDYTEFQLPYPLCIQQSRHLGEPMNDQHVRTGDLFTRLCDNESAWLSNIPTEPYSPNCLFSAWLPATPSMGEENGMLMASSSNSHIGTPSPLHNIDDNLLLASGKSDVGWSKVRGALMLKIKAGKDGYSGEKKENFPSYYE